MDISALSTTKLSNDGARLQLRSPDGKLLDATLILRSRDSKVYRNIVREFRSKALKQQIDDPLRASDERAMDARVACTVGWESMEYEGDADFSADLIRKVYSDDGLQWIVDQVDAFIQDRANFLPKA